MFQVDWPTKLFLSHGVVCGMEYLHSRIPHPVIHGDLKIQNVLVADGLVAKVCKTLIYSSLTRQDVIACTVAWQSVCLSIICNYFKIPVQI